MAHQRSLRLLCRTLVVVLLMAGSFAAAPLAAAEEERYVPGEVVVKLFAAADLPGVAASFGLDPTPLDQFGARPIYRLRILDGAMPPDKAAALVGDGRVEFAEPNYEAQTPESRRRSAWSGGGSSGDYGRQWAPDAIRLSAAHRVSRGAGVTVAVLDTGVDTAHPALAGRLLPGFDFVDFDGDPREEGDRGRFGFGHGTHVAGLTALAAPEAMLLPVRVLDPDGVGNIWVLAEGLLYAVDPDGDPATDDGADVLNLSLGTLRRTELLEQIVAEVACAGQGEDGDDDDGDDDGDDDDDDGEGRCGRGGGAVVVIAAGNSGDDTPHYPAAEAVAGSLAIGASTRAHELASFSTRGPWVALAAPGEEILSSVPGGGYGSWSGSSMAAPLTAGVAALLRSASPALDAIEVAERLVETGRPLCDGSDLPLLDAGAAVGAPQRGARPAQALCRPQPGR
jgi:thermitase